MKITYNKILDCFEIEKAYYSKEELKTKLKEGTYLLFNEFDILVFNTRNINLILNMLSESYQKGYIIQE